MPSFSIRMGALALALALAPALPLAAADPGLLNLAKPDVNFMLGIRVADIAASPLVETMLREARDEKPEWKPLLTMMGPNPLEGFQELLIAANIDSQSPQDPKDALVLLRGNLAQGRLARVFCSEGCDREQYRNFEMIKVERKGADTPGFLVVLDAQYAALGERPAVLGVIDRYLKQTPAAFSPPMQGWIDRLSRYHLWLAAKGPFKTQSDEESGPASMAANAASKMEGFGLGLMLDRDVTVSVDLESVSDQEAKQLYEMVQGLVALGRMSRQQEQAQAEPGAFDLLENVKLSNAGRMVSASLTIPQRELTRQLRAKLEERREQADAVVAAGPQPDGGQQTAAVRIAPRKKHLDGSIRVYGLQPRAVEYAVTPK